MGQARLAAETVGTKGAIVTTCDGSDTVTVSVAPALIGRLRPAVCTDEECYVTVPIPRVDASHFTDERTGSYRLCAGRR